MIACLNGPDNSTRLSGITLSYFYRQANNLITTFVYVRQIKRFDDPNAASQQYPISLLHFG
jgi:hypothetical protein